MVSTVADSQATTMEEYVAQVMESPSDAAPEAELLPAADGINEGQSSEAGEQVAPDTEPEQSSAEVQTDEQSPEESTPVEAAPVLPNWDSEENPHYKDAQTLAAIRQLAEQERLKTEAAQRREQLTAAFQRLPDLDESDQTVLIDQLIETVSQDAVAPVVERAQVFENGLAALVYALDAADLGDEALNRVKAIAKDYRELGETTAQIEHAHAIRKSEKSKLTAALAERDTKIKNLTAQLAAKQITSSGANRAESVAVGASGDQPLSWESLLGYTSAE
jgi:hypothetical protein